MSLTSIELPALVLAIAAAGEAMLRRRWLASSLVSLRGRSNPIERGEVGVQHRHELGALTDGSRHALD